MQGKTYSMIGPRLGTTAFDKQQLLTDSDGFLARAYANVFQSIQAGQSDMHVDVRASCCEVYHEQVTAEVCCVNRAAERLYYHLLLCTAPKLLLSLSGVWCEFSVVHHCQCNMKSTAGLRCCNKLSHREGITNCHK